MTTAQDYRVELDAYHGPLDLLLFLVKRHEIDLYDIPIAQLTDQYLTHVRAIERIDMDTAGEFLLMAATLMEIKSRMLLPRPEEAADAADNALSELDPRYELVQQLLAYKRFKDAATQLDDRRAQWEQRFAHLPARIQPASAADESDDEALSPDEVEFDLEDANVIDLFEAFSRLLESIGRTPATHDVVSDDTPIALHAEDILDRLQRCGEQGDGRLTLQEIFVGRRSRQEMIGLFLATLELVNRKTVRVVQDRIRGEICLELRPTQEQEEIDPGQAPDSHDPETGEIDYDWPSEAIRQAAARRAKARLERFRKSDDGDLEGTDEESEEDRFDTEDLPDTPEQSTPSDEADKHA